MHGTSRTVRRENDVRRTSTVSEEQNNAPADKSAPIKRAKAPAKPKSVKVGKRRIKAVCKLVKRA